jgi:hypothetical protein
MELIHIANATFSSLSQRNTSLENLASKQKLSGLLKSRRCAHWHRRQSHDGSRDHASTCPLACVAPPSVSGVGTRTVGFAT